MQLNVPLGLPDTIIRDLASALNVLTAMITPALLISATGTYILSTSTRLGRVVDRVRDLSKTIEMLVQADCHVTLLEDRRAMYLAHMDLQNRRAALLGRTMRALYVAACMFVLTSLSIGLVALLHRGFNWLPVVMGMIGAGYLFYASVLLIMEVRVANAGLNLEFNFLNKLVRSHLEADTNRIHVP